MEETMVNNDVEREVDTDYNGIHELPREKPTNEVSGEETPSIVEETDKLPLELPSKESVPEATDEEVPVKDEPIAAPVKSVKITNRAPAGRASKSNVIMAQYYQQYQGYVKAGQPAKAIASFTNIYKQVEKKPENLGSIIELFRTNKDLLAEKVALQGIEVITGAMRIKLEIFYTLLKAVVSGKKIRISFDRTAEYVKNTKLMTEYKKHYNKI